MAKISSSQARLLRGVGAAAALVAGVLLVLGVLGRTDLPLYVPVLLLAAASGLMLAGRGQAM